MDDTSLVLSRWQYAVDAFIVLQVIATITLFLRLWTKFMIVGKVGPDDWSIGTAWAIMALSCGYTMWYSDMMEVVSSGGTDQTAQFDVFIKFDAFAYILSMTLTKLSLGLFLLRFLSDRRGLRMFTYVLTGVTFFSGLTNGLFTLQTCGPPAGFFGNTSECAMWEAYISISAIWSLLDAISNVGFAMLSISAVSFARLPFGTIVAASMVLSLGIISCFASIVRIIAMSNEETSLSYLGSMNLTIGTVVEMGLSMAAVCLACAWPLLEKMLNRNAKVGQNAFDTGESSAGIRLDVINQQPSNGGGYNIHHTFGEAPMPIFVPAAAKHEENARHR